MLLSKHNCFELGIIRQTHGLSGGLTAYFDVDCPENYLDLDTIFIEFEHQLIPYFVEEIRPKGNHVILYLEDVDTVEKARELKGCKLYLPIQALPSLNEDSFYYHDIIGFHIINTHTQENIGVIESIVEMPAQFLAQTTVKGKEVLIPLAKAFIVHIDLVQRHIVMDIPEGLLDIYLHDSKESSL